MELIDENKLRMLYNQDMVDFQEVNSISPEIEEFQKREWEPADMQHFGRIIDWKKESKILKALDDNKLVGVLELTIQSGVMHIGYVKMGELPKHLERQDYVEYSKFL